MVEASRHCVDIAELQAAASRVIAEITGSEAGYVTSGAAAGLLLGAAACVTGLDPGKMNRLPDTTGMKDEIVMVRSQRNFYDHAIRGAGVRIVEVGLPDRFAGAGVRDAEGWEIDQAIGERTAAVFYVASASARPPLAEVVKIAHGRGVSVLVDAAAQLPPADNLRRFVALGADLVAFSGEGHRRATGVRLPGRAAGPHRRRGPPAPGPRRPVGAVVPAVRPHRQEPATGRPTPRHRPAVQGRQGRDRVPWSRCAGSPPRTPRSGAAAG